MNEKAMMRLTGWKVDQTIVFRPLPEQYEFLSLIASIVNAAGFGYRVTLEKCGDNDT